MLVTGATGSGKYYLACALGHQACRNGISTRYTASPGSSTNSPWPAPMAHTGNWFSGSPRRLGPEQPDGFARNRWTTSSEHAGCPGRNPECPPLQGRAVDSQRLTAPFGGTFAEFQQPVTVIHTVSLNMASAG